MGIWALSNTCFLRPTGVYVVNGISIGSAVFAQFTAECPYRPIYNGLPLSPQNCPFPWVIWSPSNTWFIGAHPRPQSKRHLDRFSHFAGLTSVTDRQQTDRQTTLLGR